MEIGPFVLYVEGPRDRDLLRIWAQRVSPPLARRLEERVVIMGGRQPARAVEHFDALRDGSPEASGLIVIDRDGLGEPNAPGTDAALELFTWPRRHIESYVLVPEAIARAVGSAPDDPRVGRILAEHLPESEDDAALAELDAKRLLAGRGSLARSLGGPVASADIARCMRVDEIHADVIGLLDRVRSRLGMREAKGPEVVVRHRSR